MCRRVDLRRPKSFDPKTKLKRRQLTLLTASLKLGNLKFWLTF
jgi:hypothetical protein